MRRKTALLILAITLATTAAFTARIPPASSARRIVHGRVIDAGTGKPIASVPITVSGESLGTLTRANGTFAMAGVPGNRSRIEFTHPCYFPVYVIIPNDADADIEIGLPFDNSSLQRAGCGGLGARAKRDSVQ